MREIFTQTSMGFVGSSYAFLKCPSLTCSTIQSVFEKRAAPLGRLEANPCLHHPGVEPTSSISRTRRIGIDEGTSLHRPDVHTGISRRPRRSTLKRPPANTDRVRLRQTVCSRTHFDEAGRQTAEAAEKVEAAPCSGTFTVSQFPTLTLHALYNEQSDVAKCRDGKLN